MGALRRTGSTASDKERNLSLEIVHQREVIFNGFEPVDAGETNAVELKDEFERE